MPKHNTTTETPQTERQRKAERARQPRRPTNAREEKTAVPRPDSSHAQPATAKPAQITQKQYERMWGAFFRTQNVSAVQRAAAVDWRTAQRAVERGWPERGWPALRDRWAEVVKQAREREQYDPATVMLENLAVLRRVKAQIRAAMEATDLKASELIRLSGELDRVLIREASLLDGAKRAGAIGGGTLEEQVAALDDAQLEALANDGVVPFSIAHLVAPFAPGCDFDNPTRPAAPEGTAAVDSQRPKPDADGLPDVALVDEEAAAYLDELRSEVEAARAEDVPEDPVARVLRKTRGGVS